jgi:hypothetical protein
MQNLDGHAAVDERVFRKGDFPEAALADQPDDTVVAEELANL